MRERNKYNPLSYREWLLALWSGVSYAHPTCRGWERGGGGHMCLCSTLEKYLLLASVQTNYFSIHKIGSASFLNSLKDHFVYAYILYRYTRILIWCWCYLHWCPMHTASLRHNLAHWTFMSLTSFHMQFLYIVYFVIISAYGMNVFIFSKYFLEINPLTSFSKFISDRESRRSLTNSHLEKKKCDEYVSLSLFCSLSIWTACCVYERPLDMVFRSSGHTQL